MIHQLLEDFNKSNAEFLKANKILIKESKIYRLCIIILYAMLVAELSFLLFVDMGPLSILPEGCISVLAVCIILTIMALILYIGHLNNECIKREREEDTQWKIDHDKI